MEDSIYRLRHRDLVTLCVLGLLAFGVIMVQSASMGLKGELGWRWSQTATKQVAYAFVGLLAFVLCAKLDYAKLASPPFWRNPVLWLMFTAILACIAVLVPHVGIEKNGARRWLPLGIIQLQASELGKWAIVVFLAWWLARRPVNLDRFFSGFCLTLIPVGFLALLIVIEDFGTAALIGICALTMLLAGRVKLWHLLVVLPPALMGAFWFVHHTPYRWRRMTAFLDPFANPQKEGYHMIQSLLSFATGGVFGRGLGNGIQKLGYLPEDTTDFIFAVICEELGIFGALLVIALYVGILIVCFQVVRQKRDSFGRLLAFGIGTMIGLQAIINIAVATVSVPTKGLSLPLVSAGGSGLIITCAALGLLVSVSSHPHEDEAEPAFPVIQPQRDELAPAL